MSHNCWEGQKPRQEDRKMRGLSEATCVGRSVRKDVGRIIRSVIEGLGLSRG